MTEHEASRTLVKSPPELWAELSDESSLGRHFDQFGEIRITRLEPETAVAWEGDRASGTVRLEPSGWGTRVILTARAIAPPAEAEDWPADAEDWPADAEAARSPSQPARPATEPLRAVREPARPARRGVFARLFGLFGRPAPEPVAPPELLADSGPADNIDAADNLDAADDLDAVDDIDAAGVLAAALERLGQAHHRPFSRG
jgi:hypothetical protein